MESQSPDSARVRSASARVAASSCVRISERKRTTKTPDPSKSASSNTETHRNNQRSLLEGGVGSRHAPVSAFSVEVAISSDGEHLHYPSRVRANSNLWQFGYRNTASLLFAGQPLPDVRGSVRASFRAANVRERLPNRS